VAVVGGGPVGSLTALCYARRGARVALLEANPKAAHRLAGEWLHPPARQALAELGLDEVIAQGMADEGFGFATFPDDGGDPIVLPYANGARGLCIDHHRLVEGIRAAAAREPGVTYLEGARVEAIRGSRVSYQKRGATGDQELCAGLVVGADGRSSVVRQALGLEDHSVVCSAMAGLVLERAELPYEGYGHVLLGGPGPILAYRLGPGRIRMVIDVPHRLKRELGGKAAGLYEAFLPVIPEGLRPAYRRALAEGPVQWAANRIQPRLDHGQEHLALVGDSVGHYHPLTAVGMTLGFGDALALPEAPSVAAYTKLRDRATRVPQMLAVALYQVFADPAPDTVAIRRAVYRLWRTNEAERRRTMSYLAGQDVNLLRFSRSFVTCVGLALGDLAARARRSGRYQDEGRTVLALGGRLSWLVGSALHLTPATGRYLGEPSADAIPTPTSHEPAAWRAAP
jgi:2-polyprenyl-6-methoxyphenol hydroxylase-like FAD-dependent oxidoreductase